MAEKVMLVGTNSFLFQWRLWLNTLLSDKQWGLYPAYFWYDEFKNANIFFKKPFWIWQKEPQNLVSLIKIIDVPITTIRAMTITAYFNVGWTVIQLKP